MAAPGSDTRREARRLLGKCFDGLILGCGLLSIAVTAGIVLTLAWETISFFRQVPISRFLLDTQWTPLFAQAHYGIWPLLTGTLLITAVAMAVAIPLGLLGAIGLSEFVRPKVRAAIKPVLEVLAGIPTIVYGYFALLVVTPFLQSFIPGLAAFNALGAGVVMGLMILPLILSLSEDALRAVPHDLREAGLALGGTRTSVVFGVILPAALPGIGASMLLAIGRAIGETMIVAIAAGQQPRLDLDPRDPIQTMTAFVVQVSMGDAPAGTLAHSTLFVVGATLFVITLSLNTVQTRLVRRMVRRAEG
jgi:phosphate transport system permease protein